MKSRFQPVEKFQAATLRIIHSELEAGEVFVQSADNAQDGQSVLMNRRSGRRAYDHALRSLHMLPATRDLDPIVARMELLKLKLLELGEEF